MDKEFINEIQASMKCDRQSAIRFRHDSFLRKHCLNAALNKRRSIRELMANNSKVNTMNTNNTTSKFIFVNTYDMAGRFNISRKEATWFEDYLQKKIDSGNYAADFVSMAYPEDFYSEEVIVMSEDFIMKSFEEYFGVRRNKWA
ncbi:hypothetical protein ACR71G_21590 [Xenorhabdus bovienii]|uniref:hypothetical protein n=1 Tax=Xenorhabdus bovienii TaxID=40576 RepID=UPI003DA51AB1